MGRKADTNLLISVYKEVLSMPGLRPSQLAALVGVKNNHIYRVLPQLEQYNILLYEDDRGGLYPMDKVDL